MRYLADGLGWGYDGTCWVTLRVEPENDQHRSPSERLQGHERVRTLLMSLKTEYMILGLCEPISPEVVAGAMIDGVDPDQHPAWAGIVSATLARLGGEQRWRRAQFLSIKLSEGGGKELWARAGRAAEASFGVSLGLPALPVARREIDERAEEADAVIRRLSGEKLSIRMATADEMVWIYRRAYLRGVEDPVLEGGRLGPAELGELHLLQIAESAALLEGGDRHDVGRPRRHRRYLRTEPDGEGGPVGYQSFAVMSGMPPQWLFPGGMGEWFPRAEELDFPVDWCARVNPMDNAKARKKIAWQRKQLDGQVAEYGDNTGAIADLDDSIRALDDQHSALSANAAEPDLHTTMFFALWADNLRLLEWRAQLLRDLFEPDRYAIHRPTGGQEALFGAMLPCSPLPPVARHFTQYFLSRDLASGGPFAGTDIGDPRGMHIGNQLDGSSFRPVLIDPAWGPEVLNQGSSMGLLGEQGAGKSHLMKLIMTGVLFRGGQVVTLDRTKMREYSRLARELARWGVRAQIVDLDSSELCLDPLRIFVDNDVRRERTIGFLTVLLGTSPLEADGMELADAVGEVVGWPAGAMPDVITVLAKAGEAGNEVAREVSRKLRIFAKTALGQVIFGDQPPLEISDADFIVFAAQGLALPDKQQVMEAHLAKQLLPEQILAQALLYLVAAITKQVALQDKERFALGAFDEAWGITVNVQGELLLKDIAHGGRKEDAALLLAGQDALDFGSSELPDLIPVRFVFRQGSSAAARRALAFLDQPQDREVVRLLCDRQRMGIEQQPRLCLWRDLHNRVGVMEVAAAWTPALDAAMESNPRRVAAADRSALAAAGGGAEAVTSGQRTMLLRPGGHRALPRTAAAVPPTARPARPAIAATSAGVAAKETAASTGLGVAINGGRPGAGVWKQVVAGATGQAPRVTGDDDGQLDDSVRPSRRKRPA